MAADFKQLRPPLGQIGLQLGDWNVPQPGALLDRLRQIQNVAVLEIADVAHVVHIAK